MKNTDIPVWFGDLYQHLLKRADAKLEHDIADALKPVNDMLDDTIPIAEAMRNKHSDAYREKYVQEFKEKVGDIYEWRCPNGTKA